MTFAERPQQASVARAVLSKTGEAACRDLATKAASLLPIEKRVPGHAWLSSARASADSRAARRLMTEAADLTVIDRHYHHLFQPLLYQVATPALSAADIAMPIRSLLHRPKRARLKVLLDRATGVEAEERCVRTARSGRVGYDWLILATGSTYSYFGHDGWAEAAPGLKTIEDALAIRNRLLSAFEWAETAGGPAVRDRLRHDRRRPDRR